MKLSAKATWAAVVGAAAVLGLGMVVSTASASTSHATRAGGTSAVSASVPQTVSDHGGGGGGGGRDGGDDGGHHGGDDGGHHGGDDGPGHR